MASRKGQGKKSDKIKPGDVCLYTDMQKKLSVVTVEDYKKGIFVCRKHGSRSEIVRAIPDSLTLFDPTKGETRREAFLDDEQYQEARKWLESEALSEDSVESEEDSSRIPGDESRKRSRSTPPSDTEKKMLRTVVSVDDDDASENESGDERDGVESSDSSSSDFEKNDGKRWKSKKPQVVLSTQRDKDFFSGRTSAATPPSTFSSGDGKIKASIDSKKRCRCGSDTHLKTSSQKCKLNKRNVLIEKSGRPNPATVNQAVKADVLPTLSTSLGKPAITSTSASSSPSGNSSQLQLSRNNSTGSSIGRQKHLSGITATDKKLAGQIVIHEIGDTSSSSSSESESESEEESEASTGSQSDSQPTLKRQDDSKRRSMNYSDGDSNVGESSSDSSSASSSSSQSDSASSRSSNLSDSDEDDSLESEDSMESSSATSKHSFQPPSRPKEKIIKQCKISSLEVNDQIKYLGKLSKVLHGLDRVRNWEVVIHESAEGKCRASFVDEYRNVYNDPLQVLRALGSMSTEEAQHLSVSFASKYGNFVAIPPVTLDQECINREFRISSPIRISSKVLVSSLRFMVPLQNGHQHNIFIPLQFHSQRTWLHAVTSNTLLAKPVPYEIRIEPGVSGPVFQIFFSGFKLEDSTPDGVWRKIVEQVYTNIRDTYFRIASIVDASQASKKNPKKPKDMNGKDEPNSPAMANSNQRQPAMPIYTFVHPKDEEFARNFDHNDPSKTTVIVTLRNQSSRSGLVFRSSKDPTLGSQFPLLYISGFENGDIGSGHEVARLGDVIVAFRSASSMSWRVPSSLEYLNSSIASLEADKPIQFLVQRQGVSSLSNPVHEAARKLYDMLLCGDERLHGANEEERRVSFELGAFLCGIVDEGHVVQRICEAFPLSKGCFEHKFFEKMSKQEKSFSVSKYQRFGTLLDYTMKLAEPSYVSGILKSFERANTNLMKMEDQNSAKLRSSMRREDERHEWTRKAQSLFPPMLLKEPDSLKETEAREIFARSLLCPGSCLGNNNAFSLEPLYEVLQSSLEDETGSKVSSVDEQVQLVLDAMICKIEVEGLETKQKRALSRLVIKYGADFNQVLRGDSEDSKLLHGKGFTSSFVHTQLVAKRLSQIGFEWSKTGKRKRGPKLLPVNDRSTTEHVKSSSAGKISKKIEKTVKVVLNKMVNTVIKEHRQWEREQRHHSAARKKLQKEKSLAQNKLTSEFQPNEYATICAAVDSFGTKWDKMLNDPIFSNMIRNVHKNPNILQDAWNDLDVVISIQGCTNEMYPLMGYYVRLTSEASKRRTEEVSQLFLQAHYPKGKQQSLLLGHEFVFIGGGCKSHWGTRLSGMVVLKVQEDGRLWSIRPSRLAQLNDEEMSYIYMDFGRVLEEKSLAENLEKFPKLMQDCRFFWEGSWVPLRDTTITIMKAPFQMKNQQQNSKTEQRVPMSFEGIQSILEHLESSVERMDELTLETSLDHIHDTRSRLSKLKNVIESRLVGFRTIDVDDYDASGQTGTEDFEEDSVSSEDEATASSIRRVTL